MSYTLDLAAIKARQATINLGTLGNVSEGKSTFVRSISGIATQKHQREKESNITIHLGYAGFKIWRNIETGDIYSSASSVVGQSGCELVAHYSFADCPGHEAYLATMLSGAAIMDGAALIVAANSPTIPQVQTEEHLIAAELMGLSHVFTIQNKLDLVSEPTSSLEKIKTFIDGTVAASAPIIPLSAQRGWGISNALHHLLYNFPEPERRYDGPLEMMVVRSFDINKPVQWTPDVSSVAGGVLGGSILRGVLQKDDIVEIRPGLWNGREAIPLLTRVRSMYCDSTELPLAIAGGLIGVGTTLDPALTAANGLIGQVVGTPGTLPDITVKIKGSFRSFKRELKLPKHAEGDVISFCVGIMTVRGRIAKIGEKRERHIKLERPVCVRPGQVCGILRSNGTRELLDGVLIVESVRPFSEVRPFSPELQTIADEEKARVLGRVYEIIPHNVRKDAEPLPSYERMLDDIESLQNPDAVPKIHFPAPLITRLPKKSAWINAAEFFAALAKITPILEGSVNIENQCKEFIMEELSTTITVKQEGQYLIKGRFTEHNMQTIIGKFLKKYHKCKQCGSLEVSLIRDERILKMICGKCTSSSAV